MQPVNRVLRKQFQIRLLLNDDLRLVGQNGLAADETAHSRPTMRPQARNTRAVGQDSVTPVAAHSHAQLLQIPQKLVGKALIP